MTQWVIMTMWQVIATVGVTSELSENRRYGCKITEVSEGLNCRIIRIIWQIVTAPPQRTRNHLTVAGKATWRGRSQEW